MTIHHDKLAYGRLARTSEDMTDGQIADMLKELAGDEKYILAIDQGTTSTRAIVFDRRGTIVARAQQEFPQIYPKPGWVEHSPQDIMGSTVAVTGEALVRAGLSAQDISAIGITNQRETTLVWGRKRASPCTTQSFGSAAERRTFAIRSAATALPKKYTIRRDSCPTRIFPQLK